MYGHTLFFYYQTSILRTAETYHCYQVQWFQKQPWCDTMITAHPHIRLAFSVPEPTVNETILILIVYLILSVYPTKSLLSGLCVVSHNRKLSESDSPSVFWFIRRSCSRLNKLRVPSLRQLYVSHGLEENANPASFEFVVCNRGFLVGELGFIFCVLAGVSSSFASSVRFRFLSDSSLPVCVWDFAFWSHTCNTCQNTIRST